MELDLPGFRFHPTEEELLDFYLKRMIHGSTKLPFEIITTINLYRYNPWELPGFAKIGGTEWYFYVPRDRKQTNGGRPSRITEHGFWKATGCDRPVRSAADPKRLIGLKKTLVYYEGETDWVMNEYRLPESDSPPREDTVLCKVYRKAASMKGLEQRAAAIQEETTTTTTTASQESAADDVIVIADTEEENVVAASEREEVLDVLTDSMAGYSPGWVAAGEEIFDQMSYSAAVSTDVDDSVPSPETDEKEEVTVAVSTDVDDSVPSPETDEKEEVTVAVSAAAGASRRPTSLPELELPYHSGMEWMMQDPFLTQLRSPWMLPDLWSPSYATILNF